MILNTVDVVTVEGVVKLPVVVILVACCASVFATVIVDPDGVTLVPVPPAIDKAPVNELSEPTDPAEATDDTVACLSAPDADESEIRMRSPAAGLALTVKAAIVENCGAALLEVKLPSSVHAAAFACLATVTALLAIVTAPPEVTVVISPLRV